LEPIIKHIKLVEGVQRRATKLVQGIGAWKYDDRLQYLGLSRLDKSMVRNIRNQVEVSAFECELEGIALGIKGGV